MCRDQISFRQRTRLDNDEEFNLLEEIDRARRVRGSKSQNTEDEQRWVL
jgi:hypothetical protein